MQAADGDDDVGQMLAQLPEAQPEAEEAEAVEEADGAAEPLNVRVTFDGVAADDDTDGDDEEADADAGDGDGGDDEDDEDDEVLPPAVGKRKGAPKHGDRPAAPGQPSRKREARPTGAQKTSTTTTKKKKKKKP